MTDGLRVVLGGFVRVALFVLFLRTSSASSQDAQRRSLRRTACVFRAVVALDLAHGGDEGNDEDDHERESPLACEHPIHDPSGALT